MPAADALSATIGGLRAVAKRASPRKTDLGKRRATALGQNFLLDSGVLKKFAAAAGPLGDTSLVVEIGAGPGGLTAALLAAGAPRVVAIERDFECVQALLGGSLPEVAGERLRLIHGDARNFGLAALCDEEGASAPRSIKVVGNLPFSVGTRLLVDWMPPDPRVASMTLLFQREVADRICATVGEKSYSRLSVLVQSWATPQLLFGLGPSAFTPPPKVSTAVLGITPIAESERPLAPERAPSLHAVTAAAFQQRRKMLRSSLAKIPLPEGMAVTEGQRERHSNVIGVSVAEELCAEAGVVSSLRAGALELEGFAALADVHHRWLQEFGPAAPAQ